MRRKCVLGVLAAFAAAVGESAGAAVPERVAELVAGGEFQKVESLIRSGDSGVTAFEADSLLAIMGRIRNDFRIEYEDGVEQIRQRYANASLENIRNWESRNYIETKVIDGKKYMFRKALSNLDRLVPELSAQRRAEGYESSVFLSGLAKTAIEEADEATGLDGGRRVTLRFTIEVKADAVPDGEIIRVWMPFPVETERQRNVELLSSSDKVTYSTSPVHNTIYMERKARKGEPSRFEAEFAYDVYAKHFSQERMLKDLKPYDTASEVYRRYTAAERPQIMLTDKMEALARRIVGDETNPVKQASLIYDWIDTYFPWAGAREYSTIPNLAEYALERGYGDCGQVSLLYITLVRSIGIPARWESGWSLEPDAVGMHDWAETYFEGVGWVPVDMSFGQLSSSKDPVVRNFYKSGIDFYRFAANRGVCGKFYPEKRFVRSETVDSQMGEVEWKGGNLFYYQDWTPDVEVVSMKPIQ